MTIHKLVALANPTPGREEEFNTWYDKQHVVDLLAVPGIVRAERFKYTIGKDSWAYLAVYDIDSEDPESVMVEIRKRMGTDAMKTSEAMDRPGSHVAMFSPLSFATVVS